VNPYYFTEYLDEGAEGHYPEWGKVERRHRRATIRNIRRLSMRRIATGEQDASKIAQEVQAELMQDSEFGSIIVIIGIAVLSGIIQWIVKKLLDNWFSEVDDA
jgi:hypothetical protein